MQPPTQGGGRKRQNLTLDLNSASAKKNRVQNLLTSPDVQMLKLTSPELEKFLSQNPTLVTPAALKLFPKKVVRPSTGGSIVTLAPLPRTSKSRNSRVTWCPQDGVLTQHSWRR